MLNRIDLYEKDIERVINNNNCLEELGNKSIMITGANGLIASSIIDVLNCLNQNYNFNIKIIGLMRNANKVLKRFNNYKNFEILEQNVNDKIIYNNKIDYIIHAASNAHPKAFVENPVETMKANFIGMDNILEFAINNNCKRVEYISSGEVYGQGDENIESFSEEYKGKFDSSNFRNCYPISKLAAENLCISYNKQFGIDVVIARLCHCYGPSQKDEDSRVSAQFIKNVLNNKDIIMKSDGKQIRSYCYSLDCAMGVLTILLKGKIGNIYNVANNNSVVSIKEMAEIIANIANKKVIFEIPTDVEKSSFNPVTKSVLDGSKLEKIGWRPCFSFKEGIEETIRIMNK